MKRITFWIMSTLSALVMLFSYHTSTEAVGSSVATPMTAAAPKNPSATPDTGAGHTTTSGPSGADGAKKSASANASSSSGSGTKTYTGTSVAMPYGNVQVQVTVANGKVASAKAIDYPSSNGRDQEINSFAVPQLNSESAGKTTSNIDMVSGATYTSQAYIQSLQSALDQANI